MVNLIRFSYPEYEERDTKKGNKIAMLRLAKGYNEISVPFTEEQKDVMETILAAKMKERAAKLITGNRLYIQDDIEEQYRITMDLQKQLQAKIKTLKEMVRRVADDGYDETGKLQFDKDSEEEKLREVYLSHKQLLQEINNHSPVRIREQLKKKDELIKTYSSAMKRINKSMETNEKEKQAFEEE